jgi:hypothetical protein
MFICHSMGGIIVKQVRFYTIKRPPNKTDILVGTRESTSQEEPDSKRNQMHCIYGNASQRLDASLLWTLCWNGDLVVETWIFKNEGSGRIENFFEHTEGHQR